MIRNRERSGVKEGQSRKGLKALGVGPRVFVSSNEYIRKIIFVCI